MATAQERLAASLEVLRQLQGDKGITIIKLSEISRIHRERLIKTRFLKSVIQN